MRFLLSSDKYHMNKAKAIGAAAFLILSYITSYSQTEAVLSLDSEYYGAFFDRTRPVQFSNSGRLIRGHLKRNYAVGPMTFAAGTEIKFFVDGRVSEGTLANGFDVERIAFLPGKISFYFNGKVLSAKVKAGSSHRNFIAPVDINLSFDDKGNFTVFGAADASVLNLNIFGTTLQPTTVTLAYDERTSEYKLHRGGIALPTLAGVLHIGRNRSGQPLRAEPVIMPLRSTFIYNFNRPSEADNLIECDTQWNYEGTFVINGMDFGLRPTLCFKDGKLHVVRVAQPRTIGTFNYAANDHVLLNSAGNIIPN